MKKLVISVAVVVFAAAVYGFAQDTPMAHPVNLAGGTVTVTGGRMAVMGNGTAWSLGVVVIANGVRITADRAVIEVSDIGDAIPEDIRLEGNVRVSLLKQP